MAIEVSKAMGPCRLVSGCRYLSTLCYLDDGSSEPLRNIVSDQSMWGYGPEEFSLQIWFSFFFLTICPLAKMFLGKQTVTRFINKCVYLLDLGKWLPLQQPATGRYPVNPLSYPSVNNTLKSNFHPSCFISILGSLPRILSQIIFCIFTLAPCALQVQSTLSSLI